MRGAGYYIGFTRPSGHLEMNKMSLIANFDTDRGTIKVELAAKADRVAEWNKILAA